MLYGLLYLERNKWWWKTTGNTVDKNACKTVSRTARLIKEHNDSHCHSFVTRIRQHDTDTADILPTLRSWTSCQHICHSCHLWHSADTYRPLSQDHSRLIQLESCWRYWPRPPYSYTLWDTYTYARASITRKPCYRKDDRAMHSGGSRLGPEGHRPPSLAQPPKFLIGSIVIFA